VIKEAIKSVLPEFALRGYRRIRESMFIHRVDREFSSKDPKYIFGAIYRNNWWGGKGFFSGHGSHDAKYVTPFLDAVRTFLATFPEMPSFVDLGCGDFNVGRQLVAHTSSYVACDVVSELIEVHKSTFHDPALRFMALDITADALPAGDVGLIRQVLQHLSNEQIASVIAKLTAFKYVIVVEYLPKGAFQSNLDQPCGAHSRIARGIQSGIVLTDPPFNLRPLRERTLVEVVDDTGILKTVAYQLR
jgi:hypothetical protein